MLVGKAPLLVRRMRLLLEMVYDTACARWVRVGVRACC